MEVLPQFLITLIRSHFEVKTAGWQSTNTVTAFVFLDTPNLNLESVWLNRWTFILLYWADFSVNFNTLCHVNRWFCRIIPVMVKLTILKLNPRMVPLDHARPQRTNDQKRPKNFAKMFKSRRFAAFLVLYPTDPKAVWRNLPHGRFLPLTAGTRNPLCVTRQRISCPNCELTIEITGRKSEKWPKLSNVKE